MGQGLESRINPSIQRSSVLGQPRQTNPASHPTPKHLTALYILAALPTESWSCHLTAAVTVSPKTAVHGASRVTISIELVLSHTRKLAGATDSCYAIPLGTFEFQPSVKRPGKAEGDRTVTINMAI